LNQATDKVSRVARIKAILTLSAFTPDINTAECGVGLKLSLKPGEKVAVNGAVLVNGDRRAILTIENQAAVLRERDIMRVEDATTPARLIYLPVMLMALDPHDRGAHFAEFGKRLQEFAAAVDHAPALALCLSISADVANGRYYQALSACRSLIGIESELLAHVA
jgi:flagellar protein FlbT